MANVINNDNIRNLVRDYINNRNRLPAWLQGIPIGDWDVSHVTTMNNLFEYYSTFNEPLNNWNVSNVTNMADMFSHCTSFNQPLENWNVSNVENMANMFNSCTSFNQPLNNWNVSNVENMANMFNNCTNFNQPLDNWDVSNVIIMLRMFRGCINFNQPLRNWDVSSAAVMGYMFENCTSFNQDLSNWNISRQTDIEDMFDNTPLQGTVLRPARANTARPATAARTNTARANTARANTAPPQPPPPPPPQGVAYEVHNAFADLDLQKFMTIVRRENNGASNFKDNNKILKPIISYINGPDTSLSSEQKTRYTRNIKGSIHQNVNEYIRGHPELKADTLEVIQFVLSQDPNYKDLYIETFENECMGGYSSGNRQSCTKGMFERIYMANKGTIEGLCFDELQGTSAAATSCNPVYLELYSAFTPGADIDINDIFQKWYNQFSYDAVPEGENPLTNLSVESRKQHFRDFVRQDEAITERIWNNREFQRKLDQSIQSNNIIFETLSLDAGLGKRRRKRRKTKKDKRKSLRRGKRQTKRR